MDIKQMIDAMYTPDERAEAKRVRAFTTILHDIEDRAYSLPPKEGQIYIRNMLAHLRESTFKEECEKHYPLVEQCEMHAAVRAGRQDDRRRTLIATGVGAAIISIAFGLGIYNNATTKPEHDRTVKAAHMSSYESHDAPLEKLVR